jgi:hypothetical protein
MSVTRIVTRPLCGRVLARRLILACIIGLSAAQVTAAPITMNPGDSQFVPTGAGPTGGAVQAGTGIPVAFLSGTFHGTLTSTVIAGDPSNPYGGLTFTYLLVNMTAPPPPQGEIDRITINDYDTFAVDASYQSPTAGFLPTLVDRDLTGDVMGFSFLNLPGHLGHGPLPPGFTSALMVLQTNAQFYKPTLASVIDGSVASVASFAPNVPEPSSIVLAGLGLLGLAAWGWRRKR